MTVQLAPSPVFQGLGFGGLPLPGGKLFTYIAGTTTPQATYTDSTQTTQNTNPVVLNANGQANVWLVVGQVYKLKLTDFFGNQIWVVDQIPGGFTLTAAQIGAILYPTTPAETAAGVTPINFVYPSGNVLRYGAVGDGATNDRAAIKNAFNVMIQQGGGTMVFPWGISGQYSIVGTDASPAIPTIQPDFSILAVATPCQIYVRGLNNVRMIFEGSTLNFATTSGGFGLAFDVFTNIRMEKPKFVGQTVLVNGIVTVAGVSAVALLSLGQNSTGFSTEQFNSNACFAGIVCTGDPGASTRVVGITMEGQSRVTNCEYGYCFQNNGDQVLIEDGYTFGLNRPIFVYGVSDLTMNIVADSQLVATTGGGLGGGFNAMIKAYGRQTRNINLTINYLNNYAWSAKLGFESQYNPANQVAPQTVQNVYVTMDEVNNLPFNVAPSAGATNATLSLSPGGASQAWQGPSGVYNVQFSDGEIRACTFTNGNVTISWTGALTNSVANVATGGGGFSTYFSYFAGTGGTVLQSTSALNLFNNITLRGSLAGALVSNVALGTAAQCQMNVDGLFYTPAASIGLASADPFNDNGFVSSRKFTYTPQLLFNGANVGQTGTYVGEYYIAAGICTVNLNITLTAKGSSTGTCQLTLPFQCRQDAAAPTLVQWHGAANMSGLGAAATGFVQIGGGALVTPLVQAATATSNLADTNFSNTSIFRLNVSYPI